MRPIDMQRALRAAQALRALVATVRTYLEAADEATDAVEHNGPAKESLLNRVIQTENDMRDALARYDELKP